MTGLKQWWRGRSLREQRLLLVMLALVAVTFLWLGLYRPIQDARAAARARHAEAVIALGEAEAQAAALKALAARPAPPLAGPLAGIVTAAAQEAGFAAATVAPQGERRASVSIPSARPAALLAWIAGLEARGIVVETLSARANSDPTLAVDLVLSAAAG